MIKNKFLSNGYPEDFINNTLSFKSVDNMDNRTNLEIRLIDLFTTEKNLGLSLRVKKEHLRCQSECISCQTAEIKRACFVKFAVY